MFFFASRGRQTSCAVVTGVQTCALPISGKYQGMLAALQKVAIPGRDKAIAELNQRWAAFEPKYALLYAEAAKPRGERSVPNTNDWYNAAGAVIAAANAASGVVSNEIRILDPNIAELVQVRRRSEEHTSELQSLMRISYAVFCLKKKTTT